MNTNHQNIIDRNTLVILPFIIDKVYPYDEHKCRAPRKYPVDIFSERARMSPGIGMPHLPQLAWDYKDQLKEVTLNASKHKAYYTYDATGERVRKVVDKGSVVEERLYIAGFEIYRKTVSGTLDYERETLKITEGRNTIAQLETKTVENGNTISTPTTNQRFQYSNHLGSACLELDASGNIISYEEYHPFGTTSYRSGSSETEVSLKRYKYVGKERDEETGLYYYGARYYAAWIARFVSVDPLQFDYAHYTPYQYAGNKPVTFIDLDGLEEKTPPLLEYFEKVTPIGDDPAIFVHNAMVHLVNQGIGLINYIYGELTDPGSQPSIGEVITIQMEKLEKFDQYSIYDLRERGVQENLFGDIVGTVVLKYASKATSPKPELPNANISKLFETGWVNKITRSADEVNAFFIEQGYKAPYKKGSIVTEFLTTESETFVRVHGTNNKIGPWLMKKSEINGLTPSEIQNKFALPELPSLITDVIVPAGTKLRQGLSESVPEWGNAGGLQYELLERIDNANFTNTRNLIQP